MRAYRAQQCHVTKTASVGLGAPVAAAHRFSPPWSYARHVSTTVNVHEAKTHLSRLLDAVEAGEDVVIARAGKPIARLVPVAARTEPRAPGSWRGRVIIAADFYETPDELITAFHG